MSIHDGARVLRAGVCTFRTVATLLFHSRSSLLKKGAFDGFRDSFCSLGDQVGGLAVGTGAGGPVSRCRSAPLLPMRKIPRPEELHRKGHLRRGSTRRCAISPTNSSSLKRESPPSLLNISPTLGLAADIVFRCSASLLRVSCSHPWAIPSRRRSIPALSRHEMAWKSNGRRRWLKLRLQRSFLLCYHNNKEELVEVFSGETKELDRFPFSLSDASSASSSIPPRKCVATSSWSAVQRLSPPRGSLWPPALSWRRALWFRSGTPRGRG
jgi:hypothetical protein